MVELVTSIRIPDLVTKLHEGEFLVPRFQREFVWSISDIVSFLSSIVDARPIGMITIWEQPDDSSLELEHISLPDVPSTDDDNDLIYFGKNSDRPSKFYAVLDGRQRSTAIAMAFGGLSATDSRRKHAGRFFLNVGSIDPVDRIVFRKIVEIERLRLSTLANCISSGLFPFSLDMEHFDDIDKQWMHYIRSIEKAEFYKDGILPDKDELSRRIQVLEAAFDGIINSALAVYAVPKRYDLGTICEIFETLNTTGTKVSTVDLIHSWLYSETRDDVSGPLLLREWIRDLGQRDGAVGWASPEERPELVAQFATASYLAERSPSPARRVGGNTRPISSLKSGDLLATPTSHWRHFASRASDVATYLSSFQRCVSGGHFGMKDCPYPISGGIYVALRWTNYVDRREWSVDEIDYLFRAFFWRNSLLGRYDQGFLTKTATDLRMLAALLDGRKSHATFGAWAEHCNETISIEVGAAPEKEKLKADLLDPKPAGALGKALMLRLITKPVKDILRPGESIEFDSAKEAVEVHHIYPRSWVKDNVPAPKSDDWKTLGHGDVNCIANLTPMLRTSNNLWKAKLPGKALSDEGVTFELYENVLTSHFINAECYALLTQGLNGLPDFWVRRAELICADLAGRCLVAA